MEYNVTFREKDGAIQAIISYKDSSGKWKQKSKQGFRTQKAAKPWIENTVDSLNKTISYLDPVHCEDTFEDLFKSYLKHVELYWEANTVINLDVMINYNFSKLFKKNVLKISSVDIQECVDVMTKNGLEVSTIKNYLTRLKTIFNYAIKHKMIRDNPVENITLAKEKSKKESKVKALTKSEFDDLLSKIDDPMYYIITLIAGTCGLRIGEIGGLLLSDIHESMMSVNKQWKIIKRNPVEYGMGDVKRANSNREVPIPSNTLKEIKKYIKSNPVDISGRIFPWENNNNITQNVKNLYERLGYKGVSIHTLRHTYVCRLVEKGLDFETIASLIGDSVEITIKTYSHFTKDLMTKAIETVNSAF